MIDSTRNSSIYGKDFLELVWENGQIHEGGGSSNNRTRDNPPLCIGYSINPTTTSHKNEDHHVITTTATTTTKRARLSTSSHSLLDHHITPQTQRDSDMTSLHQSNGQVSSQSKSSNKSNEELYPNLRPLKESNHISTRTSSQLCFPCSTPFKKPRIDSSQTPSTRVINFSNFSIPAMFLRSSTTTTAAAARAEEIKSKAAVTETVQQQTTSLTANKSNLAGKSSAAEKGKANTNLCNTRASASVCSLEASNDPNFGSIRIHEEDTDDSTYFSDNEEEPENIIREKPIHHGLKRFRSSEIHSLSERRRREKINEKIRKLKELIPNCDKVDKASMLDDAIDYLKTLKLQLEVMSMGRGLCMPPFMMLPPPHNMNASQLMGGGMGFRPPHFPNIPPVLPPRVTDNNIFQMFGFSNQMPIIPNAPFSTNPMMIGNSSTQPLMESTTNNLASHMANPLGQLTTQDYTFYN